MVRPAGAFSLVCSLASALAAQTTWVVNAGGGSGVSFLDLPSAVAAAATGDTIVVQTGPFGEGATPFATDKGLTIVGEGGLVPMYGNAATPYEVSNLPAGAAFRMVGFERPGVGELNFRVTGCQGSVHLERLRSREPDVFFPSGPSIEVVGSAAVTLRDVSTFGSPALSVVASDVDVVACRLGVTWLGLGGGQAIAATNSTVDVVQPLFDAGPGVAAAIVTSGGALTITGNTLAWANASYVRNPAGAIVQASGGVVRHDAAVQLQPAAGTAPFVGSATVQTAVVAASWTTAAQPGQAMLVQTRAAPGAWVFQAFGQPVPGAASPLGSLFVDPTAPIAVLPGATASVLGITSATVNVPSAATRGLGLTTQPVVLEAGTLSLGLPCTFTVH